MNNSKQTFEREVGRALMLMDKHALNTNSTLLHAKVYTNDRVALQKRLVATHNSAVTAAEVALLAKVLAEPKLNPYPGGSEAGEAYKQGVNEVCKLLVAELKQRKPKGTS